MISGQAWGDAAMELSGQRSMLAAVGAYWRVSVPANADITSSRCSGHLHGQ